jgi:diguanylate cyclase (GGDEF)-like protein
MDSGPLASLVDALPRGKTLPPAVWARRHRWMTRVLIWHVPALFVFGLLRGRSLLACALFLAPIALSAVLASTRRLSPVARASAVAIGLLWTSSTLVAFWDGTIEAHFHFFVVVAALATYEEWFPYLVAFAFVAIDHGVMGSIAPSVVYNHAAGQKNPWLWAGVHALFVAALGVVNVVSWRLNEDARAASASSEEALSWQARYDQLTGLMNRSTFVARLDDALDRRSRTRGSVAVLFIDLDNFKIINDSLGHGAGDRALNAVSERLRQVMRPEDVLARFGGDEFTVLIADVRAVRDALQIAERMQAALAAPIAIDGVQRFVTASIGVSFDAFDQDADELLRDADIAMYSAKKLGKARAEVFAPSMRERVVERLELEVGLHGVEKRGELRLDYQAQVSLTGQALHGVEALLRWQHPRLGLLSPDRFIPLAEQTGLIVPIGAWVIDEACRQIVEWDTGSVEIAVNVAPAQLAASAALVETVAQALARHGLPPGRLCLEITETATLVEDDGMLATLATLKRLGVRIAIDDFGVGHASLGHLRTLLPIDTLKIDRSFVSGMVDNQGDARIVAGLVRLAHSLGLHVVAEGVETAEQAAHLEAAGCQSAQGFFFGRPVPPEEMASLFVEALAS